MTRAIFFDLFYTLILPKRKDEESEFAALGVPKKEWSSRAEDETLYCNRAVGKVKTGEQIIAAIVDTLPFKVDARTRKLVLERREQWVKEALCNIPSQLPPILTELKGRGLKLSLISNADAIDKKFWQLSPLASYFDDVIFSCDVGVMKPSAEIYQLAMRRLDVRSEQSIFVGDGGFNELQGAKNVGMTTVFSECLKRKPVAERERFTAQADFHITAFTQLLTVAR